MINKLLHTPEGVRDIYGDEYASKIAVQNQIRETISLYGYEAIQTPTIEFFDVFSNEVGTTSSKDLFKLFDKNGYTLVLRPDFTPSIARCAAKYFTKKEEALRFCYEGNVFSNVTNLQGKLTESTQIGAELLLDESVEADGEMIALVVAAMKATGLVNFQITIGHVEFFKGLCEEAGLTQKEEKLIQKFISEKNYFAAKDLLNQLNIEEKAKANLLEIADFFGPLTDLQRAKELVQNQRSLAALQHLEDLKEVLKLYGVDDYVSLDLGLLSNYNYYTGIIFKAYTYGIGDEIVTGGRYNTLLQYFGKEAAAIGFVMMVDDILKAMKYQKLEMTKKAEITLIPYDKDNYQACLQKAMELRAKGIPTALTPRKG